MRCPTLVFSVALFYSLSLVNAIPHDVDEKRHWLHRRQSLSDSSTASVPVISPSSHSGDSSSVISSTSPPNTPTPTSRSSSSSSSSTSRPPSSTPEPSQSPSSTVSSSSSSISSSSSSSSSSSRTSSSTTTTVYSSSSSTITGQPDNQDSTSYRRLSSTLQPSSNTQSANGNVQTGTGSGSSFLQNKAAMGSTFAIVGLVGVAIIVGAVFFLIKKARKRRDENELDTYFEKFPANSSSNNNDNTATNQNLGSNDYGLGPSATDLTSPANDQTYMSRDVHYGATGQYPDQFANYNGFEYPPERGSVVERPVSFAPGTAYAAAMSQRGQYHYEGQIEDPNAVPNHPFADPHNRRY